MSKLRILCLHGFTSNGSVHAHQIRSITKELSTEFEFLFPDGPHVAEISNKTKLDSPVMRSWSEYVAQNSTSGHRAWWFAKEPDPAKNEPGTFQGLEQSLDFLGDILQKTGPVHAIWGFSQGACFAGMLMALLSNQQKENALQSRLPSSQHVPSAGIFVAGFKSRFPQYESAYASGIDVPTLHIIGSRDTAVTPERSETLLEISKNPTLLSHEGGHDVPTAEEHQQKIVAFLRQNIRATTSEGREKM
ncbi:serine hydrolase FSH [Rhexocercosporidium sp. MPI-PUGE-AT-0058]|nr:serine hydrolase FSH [Rhexocercosporidium sp. MPI-PUGE-AT-0058]